MIGKEAHAKENSIFTIRLQVLPHGYKEGDPDRGYWVFLSSSSAVSFFSFCFLSSFFSKLLPSNYRQLTELVEGNSHFMSLRLSALTKYLEKDEKNSNCCAVSDGFVIYRVFLKGLLEEVEHNTSIENYTGAHDRKSYFSPLKIYDFC